MKLLLRAAFVLCLAAGIGRAQPPVDAALVKTLLDSPRLVDNAWGACSGAGSSQEIGRSAAAGRGSRIYRGIIGGSAYAFAATAARSLSVSALSVASQLNVSSVRPKCPKAAVLR